MADIGKVMFLGLRKAQIEKNLKETKVIVEAFHPLPIVEPFASKQNFSHSFSIHYYVSFSTSKTTIIDGKGAELSQPPNFNRPRKNSIFP